jgi:DNA polymerase III subunit chi
MTTRVDFYVLQSDDPATRRITACRLIEKIYRQGLSVFVNLDTEEEAKRFDDLLWTFRQGSFVPHEPYDPQGDEAPVLIGFGGPVPGGQDVLLNLGGIMPSGHDGYPRIAEIVDQDPEVRLAGRTRYRQYQASGMELQTHQL